LDDGAKVCLVKSVLELPLRIQDIVESVQLAIGLRHGSRADTTKLLHVGTDTQDQTQVNTHGTEVGSSLAANPEDTEVSLVVILDHLALPDGTNTKLTLHGRDDRRSLEQGAGQMLQSSGEGSLTTFNLVMESNDADVFLSCSLLGLDETRRAVNANDQTTGNFGIERSTVSGFLAPVSMSAITLGATYI
jgi:hypothetical protein